MNENVWKKSCHVSPSMITLDLCNLEQQCRLVEEAGLTMIHVDILDGHFSPSMPLGLDTSKPVFLRSCSIWRHATMWTACLTIFTARESGRE